MKQRICILFFFQASEERDKKQRSKDTVGAGLAFVCTAQVMRLGLMGMAVTANSHSIKFKGKERGHERTVFAHCFEVPSCHITSQLLCLLSLLC